MTDLLTATQDAFIAALGTSAGKPMPIFQHVPENTEPPFRLVGDIEAEEIGDKWSSMERHTVDVVTVYRGKARRELFAFMQAGRDALEAADLVAAGAKLGSLRWLRSSGTLQEDGTTYVGIQQFELIAQET